MDRHIGDYVLWVLCVDDQAFEVLSRLDFTCVRCLKLSDLETPELLSVKQSRTIGEYCWTLTPFAPRFVFEADQSIDRVTYIDADLWFLKNPIGIFDEFNLSAKHVLITEHAYALDYDQSAKSGKYCVQFMTFSRNGGEYVRHWWEERCIEWCFDKFEDGKFGDQKYLDDWTERFSDLVHVLQDRHLTLAPWNASRFPYVGAVFFHFHGLKLISNTSVEIGEYYLPLSFRQHVYIPYLQDLRSSISLLESVDFHPRSQVRNLTFPKYLMRLFRRQIASSTPSCTNGRIDF